MASRLKEHMTQIVPCSICFHPMRIERSHNAQPINDGRCCDACNTIHILPARMVALFGFPPRKVERKDNDGVV